MRPQIALGRRMRLWLSERIGLAADAEYPASGAQMNYSASTLQLGLGYVLTF